MQNTELSINEAILETLSFMNNIKNNGLNSAIALETYAFYAQKADTLLHDKVRQIGLTIQDVNRINFARQEYHTAQRKLKTYNT